MRALLTLVFASSLVFAQAGKLALTNVRGTYGLLGPPRADLKVLPGDTLWLEFDIDGITVSADGKVQYGMGLEVMDPKGKIIFAQKPTDQEGLASLGGKSIPAQAQVDIGLNQPAGDYSVKVTVTDRASKLSQSFSQKMQVLPADFGIVQVKASSDPNGSVPIGVIGAGDSIWVNLAVVGFGRDKAKQQPNLEFQMRVLDESGKPTLAKPETGVINQDVPAGDRLLGAQFLVSANRAGKFVVELKAADKIAGKSATTAIPLTVHPRR
jgi:hypothetical protein